MNGLAENYIATKIYWKNLLSFLLIFTLVVVSFSLTDGVLWPSKWNIIVSYIVVSFGAVFVLGHKIAMEFVKSELIEDFKKKRKLSNEIFIQEYGELLDLLQ